MQIEDFQVQNVLHYNRKTFKNRNGPILELYANSRREDTNDDIPDFTASDIVTIDNVGCSCDIIPEAEALILHKKCPVIALAHQQLQRLLDETDELFCENTRCCRSPYDFLMLCIKALLSKGKHTILIITIFVIGLILGSATCGTSFRKFNSPILACIENLFITDKYFTTIENFRGIV